MTTETKTREVIRVNRQGATVRAGTVETLVPWGTLRAAASQDDTELAAIYSALLAQAVACAKEEKIITIRVVNETHTPHGYEVRLYDAAGEFVSGRRVAADFGQAGSRAEAELDIERAIAALAGYDVTVERA